ncbi:MAG: stage III sporulation protein AD [Anaerovoracaceae bacterium]|jgi:stage III sporulation protein AD
MDMDIFKIAAIGICGVITASMVKNSRPEFATYVVVATVMIIFAMIIYKLSAVFEFLRSIYDEISYGRNFFPIIIKVLAVAYVADFAAQICRDSGESAIATKVELAGKIIIFYLAVPVIVAVIELINLMLPS